MFTFCSNIVLIVVVNEIHIRNDRYALFFKKLQSLLSEFDFESYMPLIMNVTKEVMRLRFCMSSSLVKIWFYNTARPHASRLTLLGHMLAEWHCSVTCCWNDTTWPHASRMTMLSHMLAEWPWLATCCSNVTAWPHASRMTLIGRMC